MLVGVVASIVYCLSCFLIPQECRTFACWSTQMVQDLLLVTLPSASRDSRPALLTAAMATAHDCWHSAAKSLEQWCNLWTSMLDLLLGSPTQENNSKTTEGNTFRRSIDILPTRVTFGARSCACSATVNAVKIATITQHSTGSMSSSSSKEFDPVQRVQECSSCLSTCAQLLGNQFHQATSAIIMESREVPWAAVSSSCTCVPSSFLHLRHIVVCFCVVPLTGFGRNGLARD
jgi:hypothetical protein